MLQNQKWVRTRTSGPTCESFMQNCDDGNVVVAQLTFPSAGKFAVRLLQSASTVRYGQVLSLPASTLDEAKRLAETLVAEQRFEAVPERCPSCGQKGHIVKTDVGWQHETCGWMWVDVLKVQKLPKAVS